MRPVLLLALAAVLSGCAGHGAYVKYLYTIEVTAYGPSETAEEPATVALRWPRGSRTILLPGPRGCDTAVITWPVPKPKKGAVLSLAIFTLNVAVTKPGYEQWEARFTPGDFVQTKPDEFQRIDRVKLYDQNVKISDKQREALSLALPCGLDAYDGQSCEDVNSDGDIDFVLWRPVGPRYQGLRHSAEQSPLAEIRYMSLIGGEWKRVFLANHQGTFIDGNQIPDSPPAPYGYRYSMMYPGHVCDDLYPIDKTGRRLPGVPVRTFVWRQGQQSVDVVEFDRGDVVSLIKILKDSEVVLRQRAAFVLADSGGAQAVGPLIEALSHDNPFVRQNVVAALRRLTRQDFGEDRDKWKQWHESERQAGQRAAAPP